MRVQYTAGQARRPSPSSPQPDRHRGADRDVHRQRHRHAPLSYQWQRNGVDIPGATAPTYTLAIGRPRGQRRRLPGRRHQRLRQRHQQRRDPDRRPTNQAPTATITSPAERHACIPPATRSPSPAPAPTRRTAPCRPAPSPGRSSSTTTTTTHPFVLPVSGAKGGSFTIPTQGETAANVFYRIHLTVTDSDGLTHPPSWTSCRGRPRSRCKPTRAALGLTLDGQPVTAPTSFLGVAGIERPCRPRDPRRSTTRSTFSIAGPTAGPRPTRSPHPPVTPPSRRSTSRWATPGSALELQRVRWDHRG